MEFRRGAAETGGPNRPRQQELLDLSPEFKADCQDYLEQPHQHRTPRKYYSTRRYPTSFLSVDGESPTPVLSPSRRAIRIHSLRSSKSSSSISETRLQNGKLVLQSNHPVTPPIEVNINPVTVSTFASTRRPVNTSRSNNTSSGTSRSRVTTQKQSSETSNMSEQPLLQSAPGKCSRSSADRIFADQL